MTGTEPTSAERAAEYRWIVFDAVGTLIHPRPAVADAYHAIGQVYGSALAAAEVAARFKTAFRQSELMDFCETPVEGGHLVSSDAIEMARWRWIVEQVLSDVHDRERCFTDLWNHFANPSSWSCFGDVGRNLIHLRERGYQLAIASNFDSRLHPVCQGHQELYPIARRFVSSETGYRKPSAEFYARVISELNCSPNQILMIGDDPKHDVAGPVAAGMHALRLDRRSESENAINSLDQLVSDRQFLDRFNHLCAVSPTSHHCG